MGVNCNSGSQRLSSCHLVRCSLNAAKTSALMKKLGIPQERLPKLFLNLGQFKDQLLDPKHGGGKEAPIQLVTQAAEEIIKASLPPYIPKNRKQ